jgi:hypothetical protein
MGFKGLMQDIKYPYRAWQAETGGASSARNKIFLVLFLLLFLSAVNGGVEAAGHMRQAIGLRHPGIGLTQRFALGWYE